MFKLLNSNLVYFCTYFLKQVFAFKMKSWLMAMLLFAFILHKENKVI